MRNVRFAARGRLPLPTPSRTAIAAGARRGLLIKGGAVLERLAAVTTVVFDKTREAGTRTALSPEQQGRGSALNGEGKTVAALVVDGVLAGLLALRDAARSDARAGVDHLAAAGVGAVMLSGDNARTAQAVAGDRRPGFRAGLEFGIPAS